MALPIRYNIRNLRQRWKVTLLAIFGIALVVAAVVVIASMGAGFQAALRATGTDTNAIATNGGLDRTWGPVFPQPPTVCGEGVREETCGNGVGGNEVFHHRQCQYKCQNAARKSKTDC